jgi:prepilin-type N-terminal cleavage/methylation domain-containing protein
MKKTFSSKKSAFSLIELSIVLIIIGLLIAGVTGGASLIKSSELRAAISEARGWSTAVNGFYNQFNAFPGDYNVAIGSLAGATGNGNSQINAFTTAKNPSGTESANTACTSGAPTGGAGCSFEDNVAWVQLKNAGVVDTNIVSAPTVTTSWTAANASYGVTNPQSKIKSSGWLFDYGTNASGTSGTNQLGQNVVILSGAPSGAPDATNTYVNGTAKASGAITPADALSIDTKVDDGKYSTGRIQGINPGTTFGAVTTTATCGVSATVASPPTAYNTAYTTKNCAISYQVDLNS